MYYLPHRQSRRLGVCLDGTPVSARLVAALADMGFPRRRAVPALRTSNNNVADAVRALQDDGIVSTTTGYWHQSMV